MLNNLQQIHLKLLQKKEETNRDMIGNKITVKITKVLNSSQQKNSDSKTEIQKKDIYPQMKDSKLLMN